MCNLNKFLILPSFDLEINKRSFRRIASKFNSQGFPSFTNGNERRKVNRSEIYYWEIYSSALMSPEWTRPTKAQLSQYHDPNIDFRWRCSHHETLFCSQCHLKQVNISQYDSRGRRDIQFDAGFIDLTIQQKKFNLGREKWKRNVCRDSVESRQRLISKLLAQVFLEFPIRYGMPKKILRQQKFANSKMFANLPPRAFRSIQDLCQFSKTNERFILLFDSVLFNMLCIRQQMSIA